MSILIRCALFCVIAFVLIVAGRASAYEQLAPQWPDIVRTGAVARVGAPSPDQILHVAISLPLRNAPQLDAFLADIYNPASANYRAYLSVAQFADRFGPTAADYASVANYLKSQGLPVVADAANRALMTVDARVADVERVFNVKMGLYPHPTENRRFLSPDRAPTLNVVTPVLQILGLDDYVLPQAKKLKSASRISSRGGSGPGGQFDGVDIRNAYYPSGALTGAGQSVGLMEFGGLNLSDVNLFFANALGPANATSIVLVATDKTALTCAPPCDDTEQALDVEYTISMAPGLASVRVYVGGTAETILNRMATDNLSKVLSTSWGWNENLATDDALFKEFAAQGQTVLTASGDASTLAASGPWPEQDVNIVAVGGTDLAMSGNGAAWASESGWSSSAGGPSIDKRIAIASYQAPYVSAANKASPNLRNVPDVSASADTDMMLCANGSCAGGWGGTSFAAPIWAGFVALANQQAARNRAPPVGFINPHLYALGHLLGYKLMFHDETSGISGGYACEPAYDLVTGLGSPTGDVLARALAQ